MQCSSCWLREWGGILSMMQSWRGAVCNTLTARDLNPVHRSWIPNRRHVCTKVVIVIDVHAGVHFELVLFQSVCSIRELNAVTGHDALRLGTIS